MARWLFVLPLALSMTPSASAAPLSLGIALVVERGDTSSAISGWLRLQIPLERLAAPRVLSERTAEEPRGEPSVEEPPPERAPAAPEVPPGPRRAPEVLALRRDTSLARELVREALRLRGRASAQERLDALATRSRVSAILPELTLRAARSTDQTLRLTPSGVERYDFTQTGGDDLLFEARATWRLDRLVFADAELRVEHLRQASDAATERLVSAVLKHLFVWQRAEARLARGELDAEAELQLELDVLEAEAALDVLTDGYFGRRLAQRAEKVGVRSRDGSYSSKKE